jgi:hypothetical protein
VSLKHSISYPGWGLDHVVVGSGRHRSAFAGVSGDVCRPDGLWLGGVVALEGVGGASRWAFVGGDSLLVQPCPEAEHVGALTHEYGLSPVLAVAEAGQPLEVLECHPLLLEHTTSISHPHSDFRD